MRVSEAFPSEYVKAADLRDKNVLVVIDRVEMKDIGDDHKPVVFFQGKEKGLVLNKTNANNIGMAYGDDTDDWIGKEIVLFPAMVDFQGRTVAAIRVRTPQAKDRAKPLQVASSGGTRTQQPAAAQAQVRDDMDDAIPFAPEWR